MARPTSKMWRTSALLALSAALAHTGCGEQEPAKSQSNSQKAAAGDSAAETESQPKVDPKDPAAAARLWVEKVKPAFETTCATCHAEPRFVVVKRGPLTILSYDAARKLLADGTSSTDNKLIRKATGGDGHGGGVQCAITAEPCSFIVQWRLLEVGADTESAASDENLDVLPPDADPRLGAVASVSTGGLVVGWAVNKADLRAKVGLKLVLDGKLGSGGLVAVTTTADKLVDDGKHPGDHGFFVVMPDAYRTGVERDLYLYDAADQLLTPTPFKYKAFKPTDAGRAFFAATVAPKIQQSCASCHTPAYDQFYAAMAAKGPNEGGTAVDNNAVNKPGGVAPHNGGNACGGINGSPCKEFQLWWPLEFGQ